MDATKALAFSLAAIDNEIPQMGPFASSRSTRETLKDKTRESRDGADSPSVGGLFVDADAMKEKVRQALIKPDPYDVKNTYKTYGVWQAIARNSVFENVTLAVITANALWIAIDTDNNSSASMLQAKPVFQLAEHIFCIYFSFEWFVRFMAFEKKISGLKDRWFVFDSALVFMMVMETWFMTLLVAFSSGGGAGGGLGNASILRLFRLLRLSRMARMLRSIPELMILIKGMVAAMRSVFMVMALLIILMYVFAIAFTQLLGDDPIGRVYFSSIPKSMYTLLVTGTFLDNLTSVVDDIAEASFICAALFFLYVLLAALTVLNMLIGVLCEVVSAVAATEREVMLVGFVREKMLEVLKKIDDDGDGEISKREFEKIMEDPVAVCALVEVGVDPEGLVDFTEFIFQEEDADDDHEGSSHTGEGKKLSFYSFMQVVLQFRGSNGATVKDIVDLRKYMQQILKSEMRKLKKSRPNTRQGGGGCACCGGCGGGCCHCRRQF